MKKAIAILLLGCFALYHFGYYMFYFSFQIQIELDWKEKIFSESQENTDQRLLEIPLSLPYMADQEYFQLTNTSFEKDGQYFRVIKQRYAKDTLQLVYVPDSAKKNLDQTIKQWITFLVNDEIPDGSGNSLLSKTFLKDYTQPVNNLDFTYDFPEVKHYQQFFFLPVEDQVINLNSPPPEMAQRIFFKLIFFIG